jgi:hypothetical protein
MIGGKMEIQSKVDHCKLVTCYIVKNVISNLKNGFIFWVCGGICYKPRVFQEIHTVGVSLFMIKTHKIKRLLI